MLAVLFGFLFLRSVLSTKCPSNFHEDLKSSIDLNESCQTCKVFDSTPINGTFWTGFCSNDQYIMFPEKNCNGSRNFVQATKGDCNIVMNGTVAFDNVCWDEYIDQLCYDYPGDDSRHKRTTRLALTSSVSTTTNESSLDTELCEKNEHYFEGHCYFLMDYTESSYVKINKSCRTQHHEALALAVETKEENEFVLNFLKHLERKNFLVLTSGQKDGPRAGVWLGWNSTVNDWLINCSDNAGFNFYKIYVIHAGKSMWEIMKTDSLNKILQSKISVKLMCEREFNPKQIPLHLYKKCLQEYRKSKCYYEKEKKNFCCAKNEHEEIWFGCPGEETISLYENGIECVWGCDNDGLFEREFPKCKGKHGCRAEYGEIKYSSALRSHAISDCPHDLPGYSTWYCNIDGVFVGQPDHKMCCKHQGLVCKETDRFLNIWMTCPGTLISKNLECPEGSILRTAEVRWFCLESGRFNGTTPDYSKCNDTKIECLKKDEYGREWIVKAGQNGSKPCPQSSVGLCYWRCNASGEFETPKPDYSECRPDWIVDISGMIQKGTDHEKVMEAMKNQTSIKDLRFGFHHVLSLTSDCIELYKKQNSEHKVPVFDKFLKGYSTVLKNLAANSKTWSGFPDADRKKYSHEILRMTETAAFANLKGSAYTQMCYNATFARLDNDGFDYFVAYNPNLKGLKFPLENYHQSNWQLEIKQVEESLHSNMAAMGLAMNSSLSSFMFSSENHQDVAVNSPIVTFTIAAPSSEEPETVTNVTVDLSFRHTNKTRFPQSVVIRRRLHEGETPSGVYNSTSCYYYQKTNWSSEGCVVISATKEQTNCTCKHLSSIGLLVTIHKYIPDTTLETVSLISSGISIISLILALIVLYVFDSVKNDRVLIGKNLCFCLLIGHTMIITVMDKRFFNISDDLCKIYAVLLHFIFMAAFSWMFVEGCHLYRMLVLVFNSDIEYKRVYLLIGYGVPLVVVGATQIIGLAFREQPYGQDETCWLQTPSYIWAFIGPVILTTSVNFIILIISMKLAVSSKMRSGKSSLNNFKIWVKGWISLSTLLGITWFFGLAYIRYNTIFAYVFVVLNGLQGFFIFMFRCVLSDQYKTAILQKLKTWFPDCFLQDSKVSENVKSGTKIFALTKASSNSETDQTQDSSYDNAIISRLDSQINIQQNILKSLDKLSGPQQPSVGVDIEIKVKPSVSEEFLKNRLTISNFYENRRLTKDWDDHRFGTSKQDEFPELSYHYSRYKN